MRFERLRWPSSATVSLLAALTTWAALLTWSGFSEAPGGFLVPLLGACVLVAVVGMLLRSAHAHPVLVVLAQLVVLLLWLDHAWAGAEAVGGWLPTARSLHGVAAALGHSMAVSQQYAAPVPRGVHGLYPALVLAGAAAAVLVDLLACGLRRVPLAGLPLLAIYTAPISILHGGVSWAKFALTALCFLLLLSADESRRLTHWGRQLSSDLLFDSQQSAVSGQAVRSSARKIGLTATALAVVVPLLVPTLGAGLLAGKQNGAGNGTGSVSLSNPMVSLRRDLVQGRDVNLVYVTTPEPDPSYLRIAVLDQFDGSAWLPGGRAIPGQQRADGPMPPPPGLDPSVPRTVVPYSVRIASAFQSRWLPAPYPVSWINASGDWRYDTTTMDYISTARDQTTAGMSYRLRALVPTISARRLAKANPPPVDLEAKYTKLPKDLPASVERLARRVTAHETTDYGRAARLQEWFQGDGGFTYSLQHASGDSMQQLARFLGTGPGSRIGYCQQFAGAMALMGRALGIPSRVVVGFLHPQYVSGNTWVFSSHDLHAWPEMYFEGTGWVRFEPTPAPRVTSVPGYSVPPVHTQTPQHQPAQAAGSAHHRIDHPNVKRGLAGNLAIGQQPPAWRFPVITVLAVLAALLLVAAPWALRTWRRRRRWRAAGTAPGLAEAAWSELRDAAVDLRLGWDDTVTPRVGARDLATHFGTVGEPGTTAALDRLVERVELARFARPARNGQRLQPGAVDEATGDVAACTQALGEGTTRGRRLLARWAPLSLVRPLTGGPRLGAGRVGVDHAS